MANLLVKVIGLIYKIPMYHYVGPVGMGYFNSSYKIYTAFYLVSTGGLPIAVSRIISEARAKGRRREVNTIFKSALGLFAAIGAVGTLIMMIGCRGFAEFNGNEATYVCILAIAPTLFFICICSALRGYFQGYQNMLPTAVSEVIEAVGKLVLGIIFAVYAKNQGYELPVVAAFALLGLTIGVVAGTLYIALHRLFFKSSEFDAEFAHIEDNESRSAMEIIKTLFVIAIPISISSSIMSVADSFDSGIIHRALEYLGYAEEAIDTMWGDYSTIALPLYNMPTVLIYPISASIVPYISSALAEKNLTKAKEVMTSSLKIASLIAIPSALGLSTLSKPIIKLLFGNENGSADFTAPLLSVLSIAVFFIGMLSVTNSILQANKFERLPIISILIGAGVKILSTNILMRTGLGMYGAPLGTVLCYMTISVVNFAFIAKKVKLIPDFKAVFLKPFFAAVPCCLAAMGVYMLFDGFHEKIATLLAVVAAVGVYLLAALLFKAITKEEILMIPKGKKVYSLLHKMKLM